MVASSQLRETSIDDAGLRIGDIIGFMRLHLLMVTGIPLVCVAIGVAVLLFSPPVYRSEVIILPVSDDEAGSQLARIAGQFGGLASLAGIEMPGASSTQGSLARLRSKEIVADFIARNSLMPVLFADDWNAEQKQWKDEPPTTEEAVKLFDEDIRTVFDDKDTGLVTLRIEWDDPAIASAWARSLVELANEDLRSKAIEEARASIAYLQNQLQTTTVVELKEAIYRLMESETRKIMLANVRPEYAFRVIDPARTPDVDDPVWPDAILLGVASLLVGIGLVLVIAVMRARQAPR